ncbi:hypothetical protein IAQ61_002258, partial [Plenodomus lingam]|uniref:Predicted protein n=1 Tax=Leptosphaeria maculans (strain JN3 / isolate v23.1.3 / race Av1-4-5-6-7-8) TaxID=985895 RepID=E4ZIB2_LEPMJ
MKPYEAAGGLYYIVYIRLLDGGLGPSVVVSTRDHLIWRPTSVLAYGIACKTILIRTFTVAVDTATFCTTVFSRSLVPLSMSDGFYLPLDSVVNPKSKPNTPKMETTAIHNHGVHTNKDIPEVTVAEISSESSTTEHENISAREGPEIKMTEDQEAPLHATHHTSTHSPHNQIIPNLSNGQYATTHFPHTGLTILPLPHEGAGFTPPGFRHSNPDVNNLPFPRPTSPTGSVRSSYGSTRRRIIRRSFSGGHSHGHYSEVSKELTLAAESEFLALMELMSSMSRRSSSLKEVWMKLIAERESHYHEMDRMYERIEEYTEIIEKHERESHSHNHEHEERKKELVKVRLEFSIAIAAVSEWKKKFEDRNGDLGKADSRISELEDLFKYSQERYEESKTIVEQKSLEIIAIRDRCEHAEKDVRKHENEAEVLKSMYKKLESSFTEISSKYKSSQLEITTLKAQNETYVKERHDWMHEKGELDDKLRRRDLEIVNLKSEIEEANTTIKKKKRELHESEESNKKLSEALKKSKHLIEEQEETVSKKKREYKELLVRYGNIEDTCGKLKTKCLHYEEQLSTFKQTITRLETERTTLQETLTEVRSKYSELEIVHEELKREHHGKCKESEDRYRLIITHEQTIMRLETSLKEKSELIHTYRETIERLTIDHEESKNRCEDLILELTTSTSTIASLKLEMDVLTTERNSYCERYTECEAQYLEICQWRDEFHGGNSEFEYEIANLRGMLKDVREERERAIKKREEADRERDEATSKYESGRIMRDIVGMGVVMAIMGGMYM